MDIVLALIAGAVFGAVIGAMYGQATFARYLAGKAEKEWRTAAKLGSEFFYVVPESEYVQARKWADMTCKQLAEAIHRGEGQFIAVRDYLAHLVSKEK